MRWSLVAFRFAVLGFLVVMALAGFAQPPQAVAAGRKAVPISASLSGAADPRPAIMHVPRFFEPALLQAPGSGVDFISRGRAADLLLKAGDLIVVPHPAPGAHRQAEPLRLSFAGAAAPRAFPSQPLPGKSNYFLGNDPTCWVAKAPHYAQVSYRNLYPRIDLTVYGSGDEDVEYDLVVHPGGDPQAIALQISGAAQHYIEPSGVLVVRTAAGVMRHPPPLLYQNFGGARRAVRGGYELRGDQVRFWIGEYDRSLPLVIDPILSFSTYLGGDGSDTGAKVALDASGNLYVAGTTSSLDFPSTVPFSPGRARGDVFVLKLDPTGRRLLYATYLGGFGFDFVNGIAVGPQGSLFLAGSTYSHDFPIRNALQAEFAGGDTDAWIAKLDSDGAILYSTYLGTAGGAASGIDSAQAIAVDAAGSAYVIGSTGSQAFPTRNPLQPGCAAYIKPFVVKLSPNGGSLVYSTCIAGGVGAAIAVDAQGDAYLAGPNLNGDPQPFISKLAPDGKTVLYSTSPSGASFVNVQAIAIDDSGSAYVTGTTSSASLPVINPIQRNLSGATDAFIARISPLGAVAYLSYFGGAGRETGRAIAIDARGNIFIAGQTTSANLPVSGAVQPRLAGSNCSADSCADAYFAVLNHDGNRLIFSTYFGGSDAEEATGLALDASGSIYGVGTTFSSDLPAVEALDSSLGGSSDGFLVKISEVQALGPPAAPSAQAAVNGASFAPGAALAPGSIASLFGANLSGDTHSADGLPLPAELGDTSVEMAAHLSPLFYVSPSQINFQVPWELQTGQAAAAVVVGDDRSTPAVIPLAPFSPGIFSADSTGFGQGAVLIANTASLAAPSNAFANARPAMRGELVEIYCTGLGAVTSHPPTGEASQAASTLVLPVVLIGGIAATVTYSGLAPGFVGLYQVNVQIPFGAATGDAVPVVLSIGGFSSNSVTIAIR